MTKYQLNNNKNILVLGDVFLDIFETTDVVKISPERPVPVLQPINIIKLLGGAANVANNIKSVGGSPFLISKMSNDNTFKEIKKILNKSKIEFRIFTNKDYSSPIKKRIVLKRVFIKHIKIICKLLWILKKVLSGIKFFFIELFNKFCRVSCIDTVIVNIFCNH